jgi:hypothetical protein
LFEPLSIESNSLVPFRVTRLLVILCSLCLIPATLVGQGAQPDTVYFGVRKVMDRSMFMLEEPRELRSPWLGMSLRSTA